MSCICVREDKRNGSAALQQIRAGMDCFQMIVPTNPRAFRRARGLGLHHLWTPSLVLAVVGLSLGTAFERCGDGQLVPYSVFAATPQAGPTEAPLDRPDVLSV